jgi:predicted  nucleic acid-binding Zn-ribbon protein
MEGQELEHRLTEVEDRAKSNTHRLDEVVRRQNHLEELVISVKTLAIRQERVEADVKEIKKDVKELTGKPGKRWDAIVEKALLTVVGAILLYILAKLGF